MTLTAAREPRARGQPVQRRGMSRDRPHHGVAPPSGSTRAIGAPPDFRTVTFGLPLCADHAHLLRLGCTLTDFHSGL